MQGIISSHEKVPRASPSTGEVQAALKDYWKPVYSPKPVDEDFMMKLLGVYRNRNMHDFDFENIELPDAADFEDVIGAVRHSAPGRDGLPYIAWKAEKEVSAYILSGVSDHLAEQEVPEPGTFLHNFLDDFNQEYVVFAPKGIEEADRHAPTRAPQNLRTIFLINSDNKLIAGATKRRLIRPCMRITLANQRGFSPWASILPQYCCAGCLHADI